MEQYRVPNKLPSVEISILAQRKGRLKTAAKRTEPTPRPRKTKKRQSFTKIDKIVAGYRTAIRDAMRIKRNFLKTGFHLTNSGIKEGRLVLIYRHRGSWIENETVLQNLKRLKLPFLKTASFQRLSPAVHAMLKIVEPFVIWGYPTTTVIRELIFKYGSLKNCAESKGKAPSLSSNKLVEERFGTCSILCVDDLVHEILTLGPNFDAVQQQFRHFKLRNPLGGWSGRRKGKLRSIGGESGFRGDDINELFIKIL